MKWLVTVSGGPYMSLGDIIYIIDAEDMYKAYDAIWDYIKSNPKDLPSGFDELFVIQDRIGNPPLEKSNFKLKYVDENHLKFYEQFNGHGMPSASIEICKLPKVPKNGIVRLTYITG